MAKLTFAPFLLAYQQSVLKEIPSLWQFNICMNIVDFKAAIGGRCLKMLAYVLLDMYSLKSVMFHNITC